MTIPLAVTNSPTTSLHITTDHTTYSKICSIQDKVTRTLAWCSISKVCKIGEIIPLILHKTIHYTGWCLSYLLPFACMFVSDVCLFCIDTEARAICEYLWILKISWYINQPLVPRFVLESVLHLPEYVLKMWYLRTCRILKKESESSSEKY